MKDDNYSSSSDDVKFGLAIVAFWVAPIVLIGWLVLSLL